MFRAQSKYAFDKCAMISTTDDSEGKKTHYFCIEKIPHEKDKKINLIRNDQP